MTPGHPSLAAAAQHGVLTVVLDSVNRFLDAALADQLTELLLAAREEPDIGAVVVAGAGAFFAAGRDDGPEIARLVGVLRSQPQPTFAAVQRLCVGAGVAVTLACSERFVGADAILCPTPRTAPDGATRLLLAEEVGPEAARRILELGALPVADLVGWGVRLSVVPAGDVLALAQKAAYESLAPLPLAGAR